METTLETLLDQARRALLAGRLDDAEEASRTALAAAPDDPHALHAMGLALALRRNPGQAHPFLQKAAQCAPGNPEILFDLAHVLRDMGRPEDAAAQYRKVLKLAPNWPAPWTNLGSVLIDLGRGDEAIDLLQRGRRLFPGDADLANTLGNALGGEGLHREALAAYRQAALLAPARPDILHNQARALFLSGNQAEALTLAMEGLRTIPGHASLQVLAGSILQHYRPAGCDSPLVALLATALKEGWGDTAALSSTAWSLLGPPPDAGNDATPWPARRSDIVLLLTTLRHGLVNHPQWEIHFTRWRAKLLDRALASSPLAPDDLELAEALAEQCFHNEYVFSQTPDEEEKLDVLAQRLSLRSLPTDVAEAALTVYAAYRPLNTLPLTEDDYPAALGTLFRQQVAEPREEADIAASLPALTPIDHGLSSQVRQQYEENPYPRWHTAPLLVPPGDPGQTLASLFPAHAPFHLPPSPKILIAGTGTGLNAILTARRFPEAEILAIDLSRASLAYAARKAKELGHANIRFAQADILNMASWPERFHIIESVGVLHHMDDTLGAWRILANLLEPGGVMKIGLYSRLGRTDLKPLHEAVLSQALSGTPREIRALRAKILSDAALPGWTTVTARHDFYALSCCRDLLFHVHEQAFDLDQIAGMIRDLSLQFLGFEFGDPSALDAYGRNFPQDRKMSDLDLWHRWEQMNPALFSGMYQFWVRHV